MAEKSQLRAPRTQRENKKGVLQRILGEDYGSNATSSHGSDPAAWLRDRDLPPLNLQSSTDKEPAGKRALGLPGAQACGSNPPMELSRDRQVPASACSQSCKHNMGVGGLRPWRQGQGCGSVFLAWEYGGAPSWVAWIAPWESPVLSPLFRMPGVWVGGQLHSATAPQWEPPPPLCGTPQSLSSAEPLGPHMPARSPCPRGGCCPSCALGPTALCLWLGPLSGAAGPQARLCFG